MKDQQSYFEKADFQSNLPKQFLVMFVAVLLVLLEVGLAQWPFFYGASPLLSLIFLQGRARAWYVGVSLLAQRRAWRDEYCLGA